MKKEWRVKIPGKPDRIIDIAIFKKGKPSAGAYPDFAIEVKCGLYARRNKQQREADAFMSSQGTQTREWWKLRRRR